MTLEELYGTISYLHDTCEDPSKVRVKLALQPTYPMVGSVQNICLEHKEKDTKNIVWIACSNNEDYGAPRNAWEDDEIYEDEDE